MSLKHFHKLSLNVINAGIIGKAFGNTNTIEYNNSSSPLHFFLKITKMENTTLHKNGYKLGLNID